MIVHKGARITFTANNVTVLVEICQKFKTYLKFSSQTLGKLKEAATRLLTSAHCWAKKEYKVSRVANQRTAFVREASRFVLKDDIHSWLIQYQAIYSNQANLQ